MEPKHAVVTGIGLVSPLGSTLADFTEGLRRGIPAFRPVQAFDTRPFRSALGGEIPDFDPALELTPAEIAKWTDRYVYLGLAAARKALVSAGIPEDLGMDPRAALVVGTCNGALRTAERFWRITLGLEPGIIDDAMRIEVRYGALGRALADSFRIGGPVSVVTTACSSSTNALGIALDLIQSGDADIVVAGGTDALCLTPFSGFSALKAMASPGPCNPFSGEPDGYGMTLGEGAAFWVVESPDRAARRGATPMGDILAGALSADAYHMTSPDPVGDGAHRAMRSTLERGGVTVADLGAINAHGTGTDANDRAESKALRRLLDGEPVPVSSTKSFFGHCLGAAGILEATAALTAMREGFIPPTIGFTNPRPGLDLDYVPNHARPKDYDLVLSNSFAFGGNNASILLGRHKPSRTVPDPTTPSRRICITGVGAICGLGVGIPSILAALDEGLTAVGPVTRFNVSDCRSHRAALLDPFDWRRHERRLDLRTMNPVSRFATLAAREALENAGIPLRPKALEAVGLVMGTHVGPSEEVLMRRIWGSEDRVADVTGFTEIVANSINGYVSTTLYLKGYNTMVSPGPQAGMAAAILAARAVMLGHVRTVVCGAADEVFEPHFRNCDSAGWLALDDDAWAPGQTPLPGSRRILGEGGAMLVIEDLGEARNRGAPVRAEVLGWASTTDPGDPLLGHTDHRGLEQAIRLALDRSRCRPEDVSILIRSPDGNAGDDREDAALDAVFTANRPPEYHVSGPAGVLESAGAILGVASLLGKGPIEGPCVVIGTSIWGFNSVLVLGPAGDH